MRDATRKVGRQLFHGGSVFRRFAVDGVNGDRFTLAQFVLEKDSLGFLFLFSFFLLLQEFFRHVSQSANKETAVCFVQDNENNRLAHVGDGGTRFAGSLKVTTPRLRHAAAEVTAGEELIASNSFRAQILRFERQTTRLQTLECECHYHKITNPSSNFKSSFRFRIN